MKLVENKLVEVLRFGTVARPLLTAELSEVSFRAPSCQVRVVSRAGKDDGKLLASTASWTLRSGGDPDGLLDFQADDTRPLLWKLAIPEGENEKPILYVDKRIPDAGRSDPLFLACVFPPVVREIMRAVLAPSSRPEEGWEVDWLTWAEILMPGGRRFSVRRFEV